MLARSIYALIIAALAVLASPAPSTAAESPCPTVLDHKFANLMDEPVSLCQFGGKVLLIVNTASECGYTPQYEGLVGSVIPPLPQQRVRGPGVSGERFRRPGAGGEQRDRTILPGELRHHVPDVREDLRRRRKRKLALSRARRTDREAAALELPQVPPRPGGAAGGRARKRRRAR